ncbi:MAG: hypothetical protein IPM07_30645 [Anaerolineales bacterium]|nr:hypothetical protein [Anaerolineales bacterium]
MRHTWVTVVAGVLIVLAWYAVTDVTSALYVLAFFVAGGAPMIVRSWWLEVAYRNEVQPAAAGGGFAGTARGLRIMASTSQPAPKRGAPRGQRPMSSGAARLVDDAVASLIAILARRKASTGRATASTVGPTRNRGAAVRVTPLSAEQMLLNIRNATATQRHAAVDIKTTAGDARAALSAARRGEY